MSSLKDCIPQETLKALKSATLANIRHGKAEGRLTEEDLHITKEVLDINKDFVNMMIDICNELSHNPPFPAWKGKLEELWN